MRQIELTKGKFALVDDDDFERINAHKWYAQKNINRGVWYARRRIWHPDTKRQSLVSMHRYILNLNDPAIIVDHIDMDGLNNTKANLRVATNSQNQANRTGKKTGVTSAYKGVHWCKTKQKWVATISLGDGKSKTLGHFTDEIEAARCYDRAAINIQTEFARPNFPRSDYQLAPDPT